MTRAITWTLKILYWSIFWAIGIGWVFLGSRQGDIWSRLYEAKLFMSTVCLVGGVGAIFLDDLYFDRTFRSRRNILRSLSCSGGAGWALIWMVTFLIVVLFGLDSCPDSSPYCSSSSDLPNKIFILVFGLPSVSLYTAFIGMIGSTIYITVFATDRNLRR